MISREKHITKHQGKKYFKFIWCMEMLNILCANVANQIRQFNYKFLKWLANKLFEVAFNWTHYGTLFCSIKAFSQGKNLVLKFKLRLYSTIESKQQPLSVCTWIFITLGNKWAIKWVLWEEKSMRLTLLRTPCERNFGE